MVSTSAVLSDLNNNYTPYKKALEQDPIKVIDQSLAELAKVEEGEKLVFHANGTISRESSHNVIRTIWSLSQSFYNTPDQDSRDFNNLEYLFLYGLEYCQKKPLTDLETAIILRKQLICTQIAVQRLHNLYKQENKADHLRMIERAQAAMRQWLELLNSNITTPGLIPQVKSTSGNQSPRMISPGTSPPSIMTNTNIEWVFLKASELANAPLRLPIAVNYLRDLLNNQPNFFQNFLKCNNDIPWGRDRQFKTVRNFFYLLTVPLTEEEKLDYIAALLIQVSGKGEFYEVCRDKIDEYIRFMLTNNPSPERQEKEKFYLVEIFLLYHK